VYSSVEKKLIGFFTETWVFSLSSCGMKYLIFECASSFQVWTRDAHPQKPKGEILNLRAQFFLFLFWWKPRAGKKPHVCWCLCATAASEKQFDIYHIKRIAAAAASIKISNYKREYIKAPAAAVSHQKVALCGRAVLKQTNRGNAHSWPLLRI
jgi:hypothetical protein